MLKNFIKSLREEKEFSFYKPWRLDEKALGVIVPIIREKSPKREYITFAEALENVEVKDTGQIDYVYVKNDGDTPVLISRGEIFSGKTQERAAIHSHMVMPKSGLRVAVRCVHQSKGINSSATMTYGGKIPYSIDLSAQYKTWDTVRAYSCCFTNNTGGLAYEKNPENNDFYINTNGTAGLNHTAPLMYNIFDETTSAPINENFFVNTDGASDNLVGSLNKMSEMMKFALSKMPKIDNQVGVVFLEGNSLIGLEVYDVPKSWDAVKEDVVEKEGTTLLNDYTGDIFEFKQDKVNKFLKEKLNIDFTEQVIFDKEYRVIALKNDTYAGEGVIFKNRVIHLTIWKK